MNSIKHFIYIFCLYTILNLKKNVYFKENENSFRFFYWQLLVQLGSYYLKDIYQKHLCISTFA